MKRERTDRIERPGGVWEYTNGDLEVPMRAESEDGSIIGDGMLRLAKGTPEWQGWHDYLEAERKAGE